MKVVYLCNSWQFYLQQIVYLLGKGYYSYCTGIIPMEKLDKADKIDNKIINKYKLDLSKYQRSRRKTKGLCNFYYLRWNNNFVILKTDGNIDEEIKNNLDDEFLDIRKSQKGNSKLKVIVSDEVIFNVVMHSNNSSKRTITVVYDNTTYKELKSELEELVKARKLKQLENFYEKLSHFPAWSGVIKQNFLLLDEMYKFAKKYGLNNKNKNLIKYPKEYESLNDFPYKINTFRKPVNREYSS